MKDHTNKSTSRPESAFERDNMDKEQSDRNDMQTITDLIGTYQGAPFTPDFSEKVLNAIKQESNQHTSNQQGRHATIYSLPYRSLLKVAAVVTLLLAAGFFFWNQPRQVVAPLGAMTSVDFPDGSSVLLNSGSRVTYRPFTGKATRTVQLQGEGFFDVASSNKPFIVETFHAEVRVLGTRFNVTSWPGSLSDHTLVTLEEGKVSVHPTGAPEKATEMKPQQSLTIYPDASISEIQTHTADKTQNILSWRNGGYIFEDMPLGAIVQELQRRGNLSIYVPDELLLRPVTYFEPTPLTVEEVLEVLSQAHAFNYTKTANGFTLSTLEDQQ